MSKNFRVSGLGFRALDFVVFSVLYSKISFLGAVRAAKRGRSGQSLGSERVTALGFRVNALTDGLT